MPHRRTAGMVVHGGAPFKLLAQDKGILICGCQHGTLAAICTRAIRCCMHLDKLCA